MRIVVVAGCGRSGSSMMMAMLAAGGMDIYCDPESYGYGFETDDCKRLPDDSSWLYDCVGKAVKILDPHRWTPPPLAGIRYRAIWMSRDTGEQARSTIRFVKAMGLRVRSGGASGLPRLRAKLRRDTEAGVAVMRRLDPGMLTVAFEDVLADPHGEASRVAKHLGCGLSCEAMAGVVRSRGPKALRIPAELR